MRPINRLFLATVIFSMVGMASASDSNTEQTRKEIEPYRSWTRVNAKPIEVSVISISGATIDSIGG